MKEHMIAKASAGQCTVAHNNDKHRYMQGDGRCTTHIGSQHEREGTMGWWRLRLAQAAASLRERERENVGFI